jgi:hypothetical protein
MWLARQPGFQSCTMAQQKDGAIIDMLIWNSVAQGAASMHRLMDKMRDSPVHSMIDQGTVSWTIASVRHRGATVRAPVKTAPFAPKRTVHIDLCRSTHEIFQGV